MRPLFQQEARECLERVRDGEGSLSPNDNIEATYQKRLEHYVKHGFAEQEEAHSAMIKGRRKRAKKIVSLFKDLKEINIEHYLILREELEALIKTHSVDKLKAYEAIYEAHEKTGW